MKNQLIYYLSLLQDFWFLINLDCLLILLNSTQVASVLMSNPNNIYLQIIDLFRPDLPSVKCTDPRSLFYSKSIGSIISSTQLFFWTPSQGVEMLEMGLQVSRYLLLISFILLDINKTDQSVLMIYNKIK